MNDQHHNQTPADLRDVEAALDRLAQREREEAPAGLESRLMDALEQAIAPIPIAPRRLTFVRLRMAAAVLLAGALVAIIAVTLNRSPAPSGDVRTPEVAHAENGSGLEEDIELWLALRSPDEFQGLSDRIDVLNAETHAIDSSLSGDWGTVLDSSM